MKDLLYTIIGILSFALSVILILMVWGDTMYWLKWMFTDIIVIIFLALITIIE